MNEKIHSALETIVRRDIPENTNLWPQIAARIERKEPLMNPKLKLAWMLALVLLALLLATTAAYAVYRFYADPQMQALSDAGMITDLNITAQPRALPTINPETVSGSAKLVGTEQTQNGVTLRLDWVSLLDARQIIQISAQGLSPQMALGVPKVQYPDRTPEQYRGAIFSLDGQETLTGRYVSYQILRKNDQIGGQAQMQIDIPLLQRDGKESKQVANFHFDLQDVPVIVPEYASSDDDSYVYTTRVNGVEMRLVNMTLASEYSQAHICYDLPTAGKDWLIQDATLQFDGQSGLIPLQDISPAPDKDGQRCIDVRFSQGKGMGDTYFTLKVNGLAVAGTDEMVDYAWQFSASLVDGVRVPNAPQPTPSLEAQSDGDLTVTLLSVYADSNRIETRIRVDGNVSEMMVNASLKGADGGLINSGYGTGTIDGDIHMYSVWFSPIIDMSTSDEPGFSRVPLLTGDRFIGKIDLALGSDITDPPEKVFHFDVDVPAYAALVLEPKQSVTANGIEMRLEKLKITPSFTIAYLCYVKPTPNDWGLVSQQNSLQIGSMQAPVNTYGLIIEAGMSGRDEYSDFTGEPMPNGRCVELGFPIGYWREQPEILALTINEMNQSLPEILSDTEVQQAQAKLKPQGIEMDYISISGNGGGGTSFTFKKKPQGMSDEQAMRLFYEVLGYYYSGPWVFTVELTP
jgi:hypothetical protein